MSQQLPDLILTRSSQGGDSLCTSRSSSTNDILKRPKDWLVATHPCLVVMVEMLVIAVAMPMAMMAMATMPMAMMAGLPKSYSMLAHGYFSG